jgi:hypothetical protein
LNALLGSLSGRLARAASWIGVLTGAVVGLYLHPLLLGLPFLVFALGLYLSGGWRGEMKRLSLVGGTSLLLAFATTFAIYLVTFLFADNAKAVLAGREGIGPLGAWLPVPLRCDLPAASSDILDRYLSERGEHDGLALMRTLAWADRAGYRDVVQRRLVEPDGIGAPDYINFAGQERVGLWLELAKSGSLADINAEVASARSHGSVLRHVLATALVVHGRYREAIDLLPPRTDTWRAFWLQAALADLVAANAAADALTLLERTRSDTLATGQSQHLVAVVSLLQRVPADSADKKALTDAVAEQLRGVLQTHPLGPMPQVCLRDTSPGRCSDSDNRNVVGHLEALVRRLREVMALVSLGRTDFELPGDAQFPPDWSGTLHGLRRLVNEAAAPAAANDHVRTDEGQPRQDVQKADALPLDDDPFALAVTEVNIGISMRRGETGKAEALAEATAGAEGVPTPIRALMMGHYLRAGDWARADAWARRDVLAGFGDEELRYLRTAIDVDYRLKLATAATFKGEAALANAALERARPASCERAAAFADTRHEWSTFLRRAFLLKAVQEGRVPAHALERLL